MQERDDGGLKDHLKFEDDFLSPADRDNLERGMSPPDHLMQTISDTYTNDNKPISAVQQQSSESAARNDTTKSAISSKNSSSAVSSKRQRRSRKCRSSSNNIVTKDLESRRKGHSKVASPKIMENSSTIEQGIMTNCPATLNITENEEYHADRQKAETIDVLFDPSCSRQFNVYEKTTKTPKDAFEKRFELADLHVNSDFNEKVLPSDQKNATVFIKIDQEQYVPMPSSQYQSVFTSPNCLEYQMADQHTQTMNTSQLALNQRPSNAQSGQHTKQYVHGSVNQYAHQSSEHQHVPSSLYAEEHRGMNLEESMIDDKYNMSFDESRNMVCSQNISALKSTPIMQALPNLSKRDPATLGSRQSNFVNSQAQSLNTTCDNIQARNKKRMESKYNYVNVNQTMVIPENSRMEKRIAKLSNDFKKKHSLDGKLFQTRGTLYRNVEASQSLKHLKGVDSRKQLKSVSNSKRKHKLQNSL